MRMAAFDPASVAPESVGFDSRPRASSSGLKWLIGGWDFRILAGLAVSKSKSRLEGIARCVSRSK